MDRIPLFTSIPPLMHRLDREGIECGEAYQFRCVTSWIDAGFSVHSINSAQEDIPDRLRDLIRVERVDRDAFEQTGRPLPFVQDMLKVIGGIVPDGPFCMTNADIFFADDPASIRLLHALRPGECIVEHRFDLDDATDLGSAVQYDAGIDIFAYHAQDLQKLDAGEFVFGIPWWDHVLPIRSLFAGIRRRKLESPFGFHLKHEERWKRDVFMTYGRRFVRDVVRDAGREPGGSIYRKRYDDHVKRRIFAGLNRRTARNLLESLGLADDKASEWAFFRRLAALNTDTINHW